MRLRGLALASPKRNAAVPDVPTYDEMGYPNHYVGSWVAFFAPAKTPDAIVAKLNADINEVMKDPDVLERLKTIGFDPTFEITDRDGGLLQERNCELEQDGQGDRHIGRLTRPARAGRRGANSLSLVRKDAEDL